MALNVAQPLVQAGLLGEAIDPGPALVFVADEDMRFVAVNGTACLALGYPREQLLAMGLTDVAAEGAADAYARMVAAGAGGGRMELQRSDGSLVAFEYRSSRTTVAQLTLYVSIGFTV